MKNYKNDLSRRKLQQGFTLIELMVVTGILVMLSLVTVNLMLTTLVGSTKGKTVQSVKLVGDTALVQIENAIKSATELVDNGQGVVCESDPPMGALGIEASDGSQKIISLDTINGRLLMGYNYLTSGGVVASELQFVCSKSGSGAPVYVKVSFKLNKGDSVADRKEEVYEEVFTTGVSLRQY